jgi:prephenate dehydrogenase
LTDVAIIGLGPTGLSLAQAAKKAMPGAEVIGFDPDKERTKRARDSGILDAVKDRLAPALAGASLVVLDVPLREAEPALESIGKLAPPSVIVTDTCSLKRPVLDWAAKLLPPTMGFVGGHLVLDQSSVLADGVTTAGAKYCLVCGPDTPPEAIRVVVALASAAGAEPLFMDADEHDSFVLATSYLSKIASAAAVDAVVRSPVWRDIQNLKANAFNIGAASSAADQDPLSLGDITMLGVENLGSVIFWIDRLQQELGSIKDSLTRAVEAGEMVDFDTINRERVELLTQRSQTARDHERPGVRGLLLGDWLSDRAKRQRDPKRP